MYISKIYSRFLNFLSPLFSYNYAYLDSSRFPKSHLNSIGFMGKTYTFILFEENNEISHVEWLPTFDSRSIKRK